MSDGIDSPQIEKKNYREDSSFLESTFQVSEEYPIRKHIRNTNLARYKSSHLYKSAAGDAIRCQALIVEFFTCLKFDYETLIDYSAENNWCKPDATACVQNAGKLLDFIGLGIVRYENPTAYQLTHELALGHKIIIGVVRHDTFSAEPSAKFQKVFVVGIDTRDPKELQVIIHDPVVGNDVTRYSLKEFIFNWRKSIFFMVATKKPTPKWLPEMISFDYKLGHIADVMGISYRRFRTFHRRPKEWCAKNFGLSAITINSINKHLGGIENAAQNDSEWPHLADDEHNVVKHP